MARNRETTNGKEAVDTADIVEAVPGEVLTLETQPLTADEVALQVLAECWRQSTTPEEAVAKAFAVADAFLTEVEKRAA